MPPLPIVYTPILISRRRICSPGPILSITVLALARVISLQ